MDLTPALILTMWAAGLAAAVGAVAQRHIVGAGFGRLSGAVVALAAGAAAASGAGVPAWIAAGAGVAAAMTADRRTAAVALFGLAAVLLLIAGVADSPVLPVLSGAVFLGGITGEMMLGHWYLVDPQLPRWALQALVAGAGVGLLGDFLYLVVQGALDWGVGDAVLGWAFIALALFTALLMGGVSLSLREPSYSGVMAATGLSYLAVLTAFGVAVLGRLLAF